VHHCIAQGPVSDHQLEAHLRFTAQFFNAHPEGATVRANSLTKGVIAVENGSKAKRENRSVAEADAHYTSVFENGFLIHLVRRAVVFANDHSELSTWVAKDGGSIHALDAFQQEGTPGTGTIGESLMFSQAVCVPRHIDLSESEQRRESGLFCIREK
jgi:hypothetical protein